MFPHIYESLQRTQFRIKLNVELAIWLLDQQKTLCPCEALNPLAVKHFVTCFSKNRLDVLKGWLYKATHRSRKSRSLDSNRSDPSVGGPPYLLETCWGSILAVKVWDSQSQIRPAFYFVVKCRDTTERQMHHGDSRRTAHSSLHSGFLQRGVKKWFLCWCYGRWADCLKGSQDKSKEKLSCG